MPRNGSMRLAVLVSGSGTILEAILKHGIPVDLVLSDRPCRALSVARDAGIVDLLVERNDWTPTFDREFYTATLTKVLKQEEIDVIAMAGFGTVLASDIHEGFPLRILNTHPSLLPAFPGWHAVSKALSYGVKLTGCTVHLATLEVDAGPILAQEAVPVLPGDTEATLHERIKETERILYPKTIREFLDSLGGSAQTEPS